MYVYIYIYVYKYINIYINGDLGIYMNMYYRVEQMLFHLRTLTYFLVVLHIHLTYYVINISLFKLKKKKKNTLLLVNCLIFVTVS